MYKGSSPVNGVKAFIKHEKKEFSLSFTPSVSAGRIDAGDTFKKVEFQTGRTKLIFESLFIDSYSPPSNTGQTNFVYTKGFSKSKKYYYRFIIPLNREIRFPNYLEQIWFRTDLGYGSVTSSQCTIDSDALSFHVLHDEKKKYFLSIESQTIQNFSEFSNKVFAILNGLGYLTGHLAGYYGWFITYSRKSQQIPVGFYYCGLRNTINSSYNPVDSNPYSRLNHKRKMAEKIYKAKALRVVSCNEFSVLCQKLHDSRELSSVIILMLESSIASLLFMPGGYAIALESISDIILGKTKLKLAPIKDKSQSRKIIGECKAVLIKHGVGISPEDMVMLTKRIEGINQITNKARLQAPFTKLGIPLLPEDLEVLNSRNDFLHGRFPDYTKAGSLRSDDRINCDLLYASFRFYTLLNMLILKWIGFDNKVINYPKISEDYCKIKLKEEYYRQI